MAQGTARTQIRVGEILLNASVRIRSSTGAPVNGASGTGAGKAAPGSFITCTNGLTYKNLGTKASPVWIPLVDIQQVTVTLTAAQTKALHTTPIQLVAAPGAGKFVDIYTIVAKNVFGTIAYTGANALEFRFTDGSGTKVTADIASTFINSASGTKVDMVTGVAADTAMTLNAAVVVAVPVANPAAGDGLITFTVSYAIVTP